MGPARARRERVLTGLARALCVWPRLPLPTHPLPPPNLRFRPPDKFAAAMQAANPNAELPTFIRIDINAGHGAGKPITKAICCAMPSPSAAKVSWLSQSKPPISVQASKVTASSAKSIKPTRNLVRV